MPEALVPFEELAELVKANGQQWVRLYDGFKVCLVEVLHEGDHEFLFTFLPCARNASRYPVKYKDIIQLETH